MRVLVTWGSKRGGTAEIASTISDELKAVGVEVALMPASDVRDLRGYDAAIIGGALYANRWHRDAGRLVTRHIAGLRRIPVWLFSSGPLNASADRFDIPPDAPSGGDHGADRCSQAHDLRRPAQRRCQRLPCRGNGEEVERRLAQSRPHSCLEPRACACPTGRAPPRTHPPVRWLAARIWLAGIGDCVPPSWRSCCTPCPPAQRSRSTRSRAPLIFAGISIRYFQARGARDPFPTAVTFMGVAAFLDAAVVSGLVLRDLAMFTSFAGTWLPFGFIFLASWVTGLVMSMISASRATDATARSADVQPGREFDAGALGFFNG